MKINLKKIIGLSLEEAKKNHPTFKFRILEEDGKKFMGTCDYKINRINVVINNNLITEADIG